MLARNPKTGAPIRILRSDASLSRSKKTLVWLQDQDASVPWERWDTACVGLSDLQKWSPKPIDFFLLLESSQAEVDFFLSLNPKDYKMMFITKALVFAIGWQKFRSLQITNVIVMEEAHLMYPYLGSEWDKSKEDGLLMIAAILRMSRLIGFPEGFQLERSKMLADQGMTIEFSNETPMPLWYITQYYKPEKAKRSREIKKCVEQNAQCSIIDKLVLLNEKDYTEELPKSKKIHQDVVGKRLTYRMVIEWICKNVPDNVICVFANADIYLDSETWKDMWSVPLDNVFLSLLRWDVQEGDEPPKLFGPRNDSQDTWAFLSTSVKSKQWDYNALDFPFGKAGCDNAITVEMLRKKFLIVNPALSLKTFHLQLSNYRTYDPQDILDKPCYMYVDPTGIHDMEPVYDMTPYKFENIQYSSFERRLRSQKPKSLEVFCKMLERGERYLWKANGTNSIQPESVPLYKYSNAFQTPHGLVYGYNSIFVGKDEASKEAWSKSQLSPIHPAYESERCFAIPWMDEYGKIPEMYMIQYLPKVLQLQKKYGSGEFFGMEKEHTPILECFEWNARQIPVLAHRPNAQIWAKEILQYPYAMKQEVRKEDIDTLRSALRYGWNSTSDSKKWVVVIDGKYITTEMVHKWEAAHSEYEWTVFYDSRTSADRIVEKLKGAQGLIYYGGQKAVSRWAYSWVLPQDASVIEIQNEMEPDGEGAHMSAASSLQHSLVIVPRASEKVTQDMIVQEVTNTLQTLEKVVGTSRKPTLYMPRRTLTGFFGHAGDSFREMVEIWAERGYVDAVEDPKAVQIWMGGVGKTLLYDRPTLDWLFAAPPEEQMWELAFFGNPKPTESGGNAKQWFFWPRRPRLVEDLVGQGLSQTNFESRSKNLVFYGKVENKVQEKRRKQYDWSSACDEFTLVSGDSTPYPFTQKQYLEKIANARFGLCLAGFGKKCHREIECMAMGCVPICASDVDMENYANPPQEGVHYLRAATPEEAKAKISAVGSEEWQKMSVACIAWWKDNCSAEGSWNLTQKLCC